MISFYVSGSAMHLGGGPVAQLGIPRMSFQFAADGGDFLNGPDGLVSLLFGLPEWDSRDSI
jgi:hypothetical protein